MTYLRIDGQFLQLVCWSKLVGGEGQNRKPVDSGDKVFIHFVLRLDIGPNDTILIEVMRLFGVSSEIGAFTNRCLARY